MRQKYSTETYKLVNRVYLTHTHDTNTASHSHTALSCIGQKCKASENLISKTSVPPLNKHSKLHFQQKPPLSLRIGAEGESIEHRSRRHRTHLEKREGPFPVSPPACVRSGDLLGVVSIRVHEVLLHSMLSSFGWVCSFELCVKRRFELCSRAGECCPTS
jgi:hypothetical protein